MLIALIGSCLCEDKEIPILAQIATGAVQIIDDATKPPLSYTKPINYMVGANVPTNIRFKGAIETSGSSSSDSVVLNKDIKPDYGMPIAMPAVAVAYGNDMLMPGGKASIKVNDPKVRKAATFAIQQINSKAKLTNSKVTYSLVKIISATTQVVAGEKISLEFHVKNSKCKKNCKLQQCTADVWIKSKNTNELMSSSCTPVPSKNGRTLLESILL